ncbi:MAG: hypothetical protein GY716_12175 [bacterium]|nr:hypothetical protein [bacterium]
MRRSLLILAMFFFAVLSTEARADDDRALAFIAHMVRGIQATAMECPEAVLDELSGGQVRAVCAEFDGDFTLFRKRWTLRLLLNASLETESETSPQPQALARTEWQSNADVHERVYSVGDTLVAVRFVGGELLLAYRSDIDVERLV